MNKLRQILQFIRALLGFLLGLKKKETNEKEEKVALPDNQPVVARVVTRAILPAVMYSREYGW